MKFEDIPSPLLPYINLYKEVFDELPEIAQQAFVSTAENARREHEVAQRERERADQEHETMYRVCPICINDVGNMITCPHCSIEICADCIGQYVTTSNVNENIVCMSCKNLWEQSFLYRNVPPSILYSSIRKRRECFLFEREKAQLPQTMLLLENYNKQEILRKEIELLNQTLKQKRDELAVLSYATIGINRNNKGSCSDSVSESLVCGCPNCNCRGFIMAPKFSCKLCYTEICQDCHVIKQKHVNHICDPADVETIKVIKADTKPCPSCGIPSKKIEGCNQVWCIMCKKAWNWDNRTLATGVIHATDYFNYIRRMNPEIPTNPHLNRCNINPYMYRQFPTIIVTYSKKYNITRKQVQALTASFQRLGELEIVRTPRRVPNFEDLRIKFLKNEIDETKWKKLILQRDKNYTFISEIDNMKNAFIQTMQYLLNQLCTIRNKDKIHTIIKNIISFHTLMSEEYLKLCICFKSKRANPFAIVRA